MLRVPPPWALRYRIVVHASTEIISFLLTEISFYLSKDY
jgi:hypothetical protein